MPVRDLVGLRRVFRLNPKSKDRFMALDVRPQRCSGPFSPLWRRCEATARLVLQDVGADQKIVDQLSQHAAEDEDGKQPHAEQQ